MKPRVLEQEHLLPSRSVGRLLSESESTWPSELGDWFLKAFLPSYRARRAP